MKERKVVGGGGESNLASGEIECEPPEDVMHSGSFPPSLSFSPAFIKGPSNLKIETVFPT